MSNVRFRVRVTRWPDPWGFGLYGQKWGTHWQLNVALLFWSVIVEVR